MVILNEDLKKKRDDYLKQTSPDMKVIFINQATGEYWKEEKLLKDCTPKEVDIINLCKQPMNAIILDIEEKYKMPDIKEKLLEKKWNYKIWDTGSRGYHIYINFIFFNVSGYFVYT